MDDHLWINHVNYLTQNFFEGHRLSAQVFYSLLLILVKVLHFIPCNNSICVQIYALEPGKHIQSKKHVETE